MKLGFEKFVSKHSKFSIFSKYLLFYVVFAVNEGVFNNF